MNEHSISQIIISYAMNIVISPLIADRPIKVTAMRSDQPFDIGRDPMLRRDADAIDYPALRQRAIDLRSAKIASLRPRLAAFIEALSAAHSPDAASVTPLPAPRS